MVSKSAPRNVQSAIDSMVDSIGAARGAVLCVVAIGFFAFVWPAGADVAMAVLTLFAVNLLIRHQELFLQPPIILGCAWIVFVICSACYATISGLPGNHWGSIGKHIPIALGPLVAITLSSACYRVRLTINTLVLLFLASLICGALFMLTRNGALGMFGQGWPTLTGSFFGNVNRNTAALACGLSVVTTASLMHFVGSLKSIRLIWIVSAEIALALVFSFVGVLLTVTLSRTAYLASILGLAAWLLSLVGSAYAAARVGDQRLGWVVPCIILAGVTAIAALYHPLIAERLTRNDTVNYLSGIGQLILGGTDQIAVVLGDGGGRLQLAAVAIDLIRQRPWLGWGPDASRLIGLLSTFPDVRDLTQFHNGYLQSLVSFGWAGASLMVAYLIMLTRAAWHKWTLKGSDRLSPSLFAATMGLTVYLLISNVSESILFVKPAAMTGMFLAVLICIKTSAVPNGLADPSPA